MFSECFPYGGMPRGSAGLPLRGFGPSRNDRVGTGWACGGRHGLATSCLNAVIASHRVAWQSRRDGTGEVENVQEAAKASAGLPRRGFGPFLAMTGEKEGVLATTGWERDGRGESVMVWLCPAHNAVIASHRVAWQSSRDDTGAVENVQEAANASAGLPRRDVVPPRNDRRERRRPRNDRVGTGWA